MIWGESSHKKDCYCNKPLTLDFFKDMLFQLWSSEIKNFSIEDVEKNLWARQAGLDDKSLARSVNEFNLAFTKYGINSCMQKIVFLAETIVKLFSLLPLGIIE